MGCKGEEREFLILLGSWPAGSASVVSFGLCKLGVLNIFKIAWRLDKVA